MSPKEQQPTRPRTYDAIGRLVIFVYEAWFGTTYTTVQAFVCLCHVSDRCPNYTTERCAIGGKNG
jgi:hypothetical protein